MPIYRFFNMAPIRHLGFVVRVQTTHEELAYLVIFIITQNLVRIGAVLWIICQF